MACRFGEKHDLRTMCRARRCSTSAGASTRSERVLAIVLLALLCNVSSAIRCLSCHHLMHVGQMCNRHDPSNQADCDTECYLAQLRDVATGRRWVAYGCNRPNDRALVELQYVDSATGEQRLSPPNKEELINSDIARYASMPMSIRGKQFDVDVWFCRSPHEIVDSSTGSRLCDDVIYCIPRYCATPTIGQGVPPPPRPPPPQPDTTLAIRTTPAIQTTPAIATTPPSQTTTPEATPTTTPDIPTTTPVDVFTTLAVAVQFERPIYTFSTVECNADAMIGVLRVKDPRQSIQYAVASGAHSPFFTIDISTGQLSVSQPLVVDTTYQLSVVARDGSATTSVQCNVTCEQPDENLRFSSERYRFRLPLDLCLSGGSAVGTIEAFDPDMPGGDVQYSIESDDRFAIDASGTIILLQPLEIVDSAIVELTASADGAAGGTATAQVEIDLSDCLNAPPEFSREQYTFRIVDCERPRTRLGFVAASDPNGDVLQYELISAAATSTGFAIDASTGQFELVSPIGTLPTAAAAGAAMLSMVVRVSDGRPNGTVEVGVQVDLRLCVNTPPTFSSAQYEFQVPRALCFAPTQNGYLGFVTAQDVDVDSGLTLQLDEQSPIAALFQLDEIGRLSPASDLSLLPENQLGALTFNASASDGQSEVQVQIVVDASQCVNRPPRISGTSPLRISVQPNSACRQGEQIAVLSAVDDEANERGLPPGQGLQFSVVDQGASIVAIDADGTLRFASEPTGDESATQIIEVQVTDADGQSSTTVVEIDVQQCPAHRAPRFDLDDPILQDFTFEISGDACRTIGAAVGVLPVRRGGASQSSGQLVFGDDSDEFNVVPGGSLLTNVAFAEDGERRFQTTVSDPTITPSVAPATVNVVVRLQCRGEPGPPVFLPEAVQQAANPIVITDCQRVQQAILSPFGSTDPDDLREDLTYGLAPDNSGVIVDNRSGQLSLQRTQPTADVVLTLTVVDPQGLSDSLIVVVRFQCTPPTAPDTSVPRIVEPPLRQLCSPQFQASAALGVTEKLVYVFSGDVVYRLATDEFDTIILRDAAYAYQLSSVFPEAVAPVSAAWASNRFLYLAHANGVVAYRTTSNDGIFTHDRTESAAATAAQVPLVQAAAALPTDVAKPLFLAFDLILNRLVLNALQDSSADAVILARTFLSLVGGRSIDAMARCSDSLLVLSGGEYMKASAVLNSVEGGKRELVLGDVTALQRIGGLLGCEAGR